MPGPYQQNFLPVIPFGLTQGPPGQNWQANLPPPGQPQDVGGPFTPPAGIVRRSTPASGHARRMPIPAHTAKAIVSTFFPPRPTIFSQAVGAAQEFVRRSAPRVHLAPPVVGPAPPIVNVVVTTQSVGRGQRAFAERFLPLRLVVPQAVIARGPPAPRGLNISAAKRRAYVGRNPLKALVAPPIVQTQVFIASTPLVVSQAVKRAAKRYPGSVRLPQLIGAPLPLARGLNVGTAKRRAYVGRNTPAPHLARPVLAAPRTPPTLVVSQAVARSQARRWRDVVPAPHLSPPVVSHKPPVSPGEFNYQAVARILTRRTVPRPHVAAPVPFFLAPAATILTDQAQHRAYVGRTTPSPHLAPAIVTPQPPFLPVPLLDDFNRADEDPVSKGGSWAFDINANEGAQQHKVVSQQLVSETGSEAYNYWVAPFAQPVKCYIELPTIGSAGATELLHLGFFNDSAFSTSGLEFFYRPAGINLDGKAPFFQIDSYSPSLNSVFCGSDKLKDGDAWGFSIGHGVAELWARYSGTWTRIGTNPFSLTTQTGLLAIVTSTSGGGHVYDNFHGGSPPLPGSTLVYQSLRRPYVGRAVPGPHLAKPSISTVPFLAPPATVITNQSIARALTRRTVPRPHLATLGASRPVPSGEFNYQAVARAQTRRGPFPKPHLPTLGAPTPLPSGIFVYKSRARQLQRRDGRVRLPALGAATPVPRGTFLSQSLPRALRGRGPNPRPHLATPIVSTVPFLAPPPLVVSQAVERGWASRFRTVPAPHLAPHVPFAAGPGATVKLQSQARQLRRREGRVLLPKLGAAPPVPRGTFVSQALERPYVGRRASVTLRATPLVAPAVPFRTYGFYSYQAIQRALLGRGGNVTLPTRGAPPPVPTGEFDYQATQRALTRRSLPRPARVAQPIVAPGFAVPGATIKLQAVQRAYVERRARPPHLPRLGAPAPVAAGTFVSQALRRPHIERRARPAHLASPLVFFPKPFLPRAYVVSQALQRPYVGRRVIPPHLAKRGAPKPVPVGTFVNQAVKRNYWTGRTVPLHPRLAPPIVKPPQAPLKTKAIVYYQAIQRPYVGRKVPQPPQRFYQPYVFVPTQLPVPLPPITQTGTSEATVVSGVSGGAFRLEGVTGMDRVDGLTGGQGTPQQGITNPQSNEEGS